MPPSAKLPRGHPFAGVIEEAYRVFSYPKPTRTGVCEGCCMEASIEADFFNPDIEDLPLPYIRDWFFAACDPKGVDKTIWAYLLPRILEVLACDEDVSANGLEVSLSRFETGNPVNWSAEEWRVLDRFQRLFLMREIDRQGHDYLDDTICMFNLGGWPLETLLAQVADVADDKLVCRFWNDWCAGRVPGRKAIWITAFWPSPNNSKIFDFYTSKEMHQRFEKLAFADDTKAELAEKAIAVAGIIETNATWNQRET
nr:hypothetical protein [uncultured Ruegeria sp.]